jgi:hypothetical protein
MGPAQAYKTYQVLVPPTTHTRPATCEEVDCDPYRKGWSTTLSLEGQAGMIHTVRTSGRPFTEATDGTSVTFVFEPGTKCFKSGQHRIQVKPELYVVRGGDHRGNPTGHRRQHTRPQDWVEDFATHQLTLADKLKEG